MAFPALLDACVLYPAYLCDTLLRLAEAEAYRPLWSTEILTELSRNVIEAGIPDHRVDRRITHMTRSFPDAMVTGYETLIDGMTNHPKDRHVLAAAVRANAEVVVTFNIRDFLESALKPYETLSRSTPMTSSSTNSTSIRASPSTSLTSRRPPTGANPRPWRDFCRCSNVPAYLSSPPKSGATSGDTPRSPYRGGVTAADPGWCAALVAGPTRADEPQWTWLRGSAHGQDEAPVSDEDAACLRRIKFGRLPSLVRPEDWIEETETDPPAHELQRSMPIVQHPGRTYET